MKTDVYRKLDHVVTRRIVDETLLVPVKGRIADMRRVYVLHGAGEFIWKQLDGRKSLADVLDRVVGEHDVDPARAAADLNELIEDLFKADLIEKVA